MLVNPQYLLKKHLFIIIMANQISIFSVLLITVALLASSIVAIILFRKFQYKLEPVHVFLLNYLGTANAILLSWFVITILRYFCVSKDTCFEYLVLMSSNLACSLGILCMQVDRIVALCQPLRYNSLVNTTTAIRVCSFNAVLAVLLTVGIHLIDRDYVKCAEPPLLIFTRATSILFDGLLSLLSVSATIIVAVSSWVTHRHLARNSIHPSRVSLRPKNTSQEPEVLTNEEKGEVRRLDNDPDMFYRSEELSISCNEILSISGNKENKSRISKSVATECLHNYESPGKSEISVYPDSSSIPVNCSGASSSVGKNFKEATVEDLASTAQNEDPSTSHNQPGLEDPRENSLFERTNINIQTHRCSVLPESNRDPENKQINDGPIADILKKTAAINLTLLMHLIAVAPRVVLGLLNINCDPALGECDTFLQFYMVVGYFRTLSFIIQLVIVLAMFH